MTVLPVVAREMGVLARRRSTYWSRWVTAVIALSVMFWLLLVSSSSVSFAGLGRSIFLILSSLCFTFAALVGMQATSDCVSEEKREGTLGLLFLTDLKGVDVIAGKLAVSSMHAVLVLIGVIPMLSLAFLLGGVTLHQFSRVALVLVNTMFLSLALGVFVSTLSENERKAMMGTFVGLLLVVLGPFIVGILWLQSYRRLPEEILALSPLYAFASIHTNPLRVPVAPLYFWHSLAVTHGLAWIFLLISAWLLPRCVNDLPSGRFRRLREFSDNFVFGRREVRKKHRAELLDKNAFLWLASRERVKPKYAWGIIAFFAGLYLWIALQFDDMLYDLAVSGAIMVLTHLVFKIWAASEVCSRLIQDRRSGALELLLSTPLSVREIARGQTMALARIFFKPIVILLGLEAFLLYGGLNASRQMVSNETRILVYGVAIITFLVDLWALKWVGLWLSLTGKSIERVLLNTIVRVLFLPWLLFAVWAGWMAMQMMQAREPSLADLVSVWGMASVFVSVALGFLARYKFLTRFRELAARQFDAVAEPEEEKSRETARESAETPSRTGWSMPKIFQRRPVASGLFAALALLVLFAWGRGKFWSYRLNAEIKAARAAQFPVTLSEAARYNPAPPRRENAFANFAQPNWRGGSLGKRNLRINGREPTPEEWKAHVREQAAQLLAANQAQVSALWRLPDYRRAHIDPMAKDLWAVQFSQMGYAAVGEADLLIWSHLSEPSAPGHVEQSVRGLLAHARLLRQQPLALAQYSAGESLRRLSNGLEEVLEANLLSDEALARLQREAQGLDDLTALVRTIALQRAFFLEPPPDSRAMPMPVRPPGFLSSVELFLDGIGSRDKRIAQVLGDYAQAIELAELPNPQRLEALKRMELQSLERARQRSVVARGGLPTPFGHFPEVFWSDAAFTAQLRLVQTALAAEQFERRYGKAPANVGRLVPEFLPSLPVIDPFTGKELRAALRGGELLIYSLGPDLDDDTAQPGAPKTGTDLVFRFRSGKQGSQ